MILKYFIGIDPALFNFRVINARRKVSPPGWEGRGAGREPGRPGKEGTRGQGQTGRVVGRLWRAGCRMTGQAGGCRE